MPGTLGRSETRESDRPFLPLRKMARVDKNDVSEWHRCVCCDSARLIVPDDLYLQRSMLVITDMESRGAMPGKSSFCTVGFRCEVKWNVNQYVYPSVANFQALGHLSGVHEIRYSSSLYKVVKKS
jgi:hypothetical protein